MELDVLVRDLHALREGAGQPSFGDIALGVSRVRRERGLALEQARVGRTTVYDAFRLGRRRLDSELVADIVLALGGGEAEAGRLAAMCRAAQVRGTSAVQPEEPSPDVADPAQAVAVERRPWSGLLIVVVLLCSVAINFSAHGLVELLRLPVFLDMLGTAFSAIVLGPWWGALVGVATNVAGTATSGPASLLFIPVNVAGALVWGYGVRRWRMGRSIPRFFALNVVVGVVCTLLAAPIIVLALGGTGHHAADDITTSVRELSHSLWLAVGVSNLLTSVADKLIAGFVSLALIEALPTRMRAGTPRNWLTGEAEQEMAVRACSDFPRQA